MIETISQSVRNEYDRKICRGCSGGGGGFLRGEGGENICIYLFVKGD